MPHRDEPVRVVETGDELEIRICPRLVWPFLLVQLLMLLLLPPFLVVLVLILVSTGDWFMRIVLGLLAVGGVWAELLLGRSFLSYIAGREVIRVDPDTMQHEHRLFGIPFRRTYDLNRVRDIAVYKRYGQKHPLPGTTVYSDPLFDSGIVIFRYDGRSVRFGIGLMMIEGEAIVDRLKARLPTDLPNS